MKRLDLSDDDISILLTALHVGVSEGPLDEREGVVPLWESLEALRDAPEGSGPPDAVKAAIVALEGSEEQLDHIYRSGPVQAVARGIDNALELLRGVVKS